MKGTRRRVTVAAGALLAVATSLTGCGTKYAAGDQESSTDQIVTVWSGRAPGTPYQKHYTAQFEEFTRRTGIKVDAKWVGDAIWTSLRTAVPAGQGPDVLSMEASRIDDYKFLADHEPLLKQSTSDGATLESTVDKRLLDIGRTDAGRLVMIPEQLQSFGVWFNGATHPEYRTAPPKTMDDLIAAAKTAGSSKQAGVSLDGTQVRQVSRWFTYPLLKLAGPGSVKALGTTKDGAAWDRPEVLQAARTAARLVGEGVFQPGFQGSKSPSAQNAWAQNKMAMLLQGSWVRAEVKAQMAPGFTPEVFPFPSVGTGKYDDLTMIGALGWAMSDKAAGKPAAEKLLMFLMGKENQAQLAAGLDAIPARSDIAAPAGLKAFRTWMSKSSAVSRMDDAAPSAAGDWWANVASPLISGLLWGKLSPEDFVAQGKAQTVAYWKSHS